MLPDTECVILKGVKEGGASPVPEGALDIWTVSGGISVLSFNLTWKMKCRSMHNHTFFLFFLPFFVISFFSKTFVHTVSFLYKHLNP